MLKGLAVELGRKVAVTVGGRLGTALAAYLLAQGIPQELASQMLLALGVVGGLAMDMLAHQAIKRGRS